MSTDIVDVVDIAEEMNNVQVEQEKPVKKKVAKKKAVKKVELPCGDCKSRSICRAQGWCKRA